MRRPADAEAYRQTTLAAANRDVRIRQAEAEAQEVRLHAEAAAAQTKLQADAAAAAMRVQAEAQADATRLNGQADADAIRAKGAAEADAIRARMEAEALGIERRAAALSQNQEAVIAQQIAENLPEVVRAAASSFDHVSNFTVLNGAQGVTAAMAEIIQQAGALSDMARGALSPLARDGSTNTSTNGASTNGSNGHDAHAAHEGNGSTPPLVTTGSGGVRRRGRGTASRPEAGDGGEQAPS